MMKAAVVREFGKPLTIEDYPVPEVPRGQILVKIEASGICHTDLHAADGDWPVKPTLPFIPGHEGVGFVAAVGAGVKAGRHWPPVEEVDNDDFAALIHDGTVASFAVGDWPASARIDALTRIATGEGGE